MKNEYFEVRVSFNDSNYESLYARLYLHNIENILEESSQIIFYIDEDSENKIIQIKNDLLNSGLITPESFDYEKFEDKNWNSEWERSIEPVYIKDKIIVSPSWKMNDLKNAGDKIVIEIDPKMSFGTGHNETTQLVLELMADYIKGDEEKMLDFGCGTAVLAIAGVKLGVKRAVAIDTDEDSIENAEEYISKNNVKDRIELKKASIEEISESGFDIICANIVRSVIVESFDEIDRKLKKGGKLFISGILCSEDMHISIELKRYNFELIEKRYKAEWTGYYAVKVKN